MILLNQIKGMLILIVGFLLLLNSFSLEAEAIDSKGRDFIIAFQPNFKNEGNLSLMISGEESTNGSVQVPGLNFVAPFEVIANTITTIDLPKSLQNQINDQVTKLGIRITSEKEITVYGLNRKEATTDAFLSIPIDALGLEYMVMSMVSSNNDIPSQMVVVGVYDNTEITITPPVQTKGHAANIPFNVILNSNETYALEAVASNSFGGGDLTGTLVKSSAPIALLSGVRCGFVLAANPCDHLVEMMPPISSWGTSFFMARTNTRKADLIRFLASENNTVVRFGDQYSTEEITLNRGEYATRFLFTHAEVSSTAPILVAQFAASEGFDRAKYGDPFMMLVSPTEQFLNNYTFNSLGPDVGFINNFVTIIGPTSEMFSILIDGETLIPGYHVPIKIGASEYSFIHYTIGSGSHNVSSLAPIGIYIYGYGVADSYGYPGGTAFELINSKADFFPPNVKLTQVGATIEGLAGDDEDINLNGLLDVGEDINSNNILDLRSEDLNNNGVLDPGEDLNNNNLLDIDTGISKIQLEPGSDNLILTINSMNPGTTKVNFSVSPADPGLASKGAVIITDASGNSVIRPIVFSSGLSLRNVKVISVLSTVDLDLDNTSFVTQPNLINVVNGQTIIEWNYDSIDIDQIEDLGYEVVLRNINPGEKRLVTHSLSLSYTDVNGNNVSLELGEQVVDVLSSIFQLDVQTDRNTYQENEAVFISSFIENLSSLPSVTNMLVSIFDENGDIVEKIGLFSDLVIGAGESKNVSLPLFNTGTLFEGDYEVRAELIDSTGQTIVSTATPFIIIDSSGSKVAADITSDKITYQPLESIQINERISNIAANVMLEGFSLKTTVYAPSGEVFWMQAQSLPQISPKGFKDINYTVPFMQALPGEYRLELTVSNADGAINAIDNTFVTLRSTSDTGVGLVGLIEVTPLPVFKSEIVDFISSIENTGNTSLNDATLVLSIIDLSSEIVLDEWIVSGVNIPIGGTYTFDQIFEVWGEIDETYFAVLSVEMVSGRKVLFRAPISIANKFDIDYAVTNDARLLILLDSSKKDHDSDDEHQEKHSDDHEKNDDHHDASNAADLDQQRLELERLLRVNGWVYTIVTDDKVFAQELRSGAYTMYALFSKQEKLDNQLLKELREAVYRGSGLIVSGSEDSRNKEIFKILGIKLVGDEVKIAGVELLGGDPYVVGSTNNIIDGNKIQRIVTIDAEVIGLYQVDSESKENDDDAEHDREDVAVTHNNYGNGESVYIGFDLPLQLGSEGGESFFSQLFMSALADVRPVYTRLMTGGVIPVKLAIRNKGSSTQGQAIITLQPGLEIIDASTTTQETDNKLVWPFDLDTNETNEVIIWVRLPMNAGDRGIASLIQVGVSPNLRNYLTINLTVPVEKAIDITSVWEDAQSLRDNKVYKKVIKYIDKAHEKFLTGEYSGSLQSAIKATDELIDIDTEESREVRDKLAIALRGLALLISDMPTEDTSDDDDDK